MSDQEKAVLLEKGKRLLAKARARNKSVSSATISKEIRAAVAKVRAGK